MRRFYQESWQGIPFSAFTHVSFFHLANAEFYATFYEELFRRFHCWDCLPAAWRMCKDRGARWIAEQIQAQEAKRLSAFVSERGNKEMTSEVFSSENVEDTDKSILSEGLAASAENMQRQASSALELSESVLSEDEAKVAEGASLDALAEDAREQEIVMRPDLVDHVDHLDHTDLFEKEAKESVVTTKMPMRVLCIGSGVGYLEKSLLDMLPHIELHVNEPSTAGLRWLKDVVPLERIYIGPPSSCLPSEIQYDVIYFSAVDYSFTDEEFAFALREIKAQLAPEGRLLCLSSSLLEEYSFVGSAVNIFKIGLRAVLHFLGVRRQQFWGWRRTQEEYMHFFENAGFKNIHDGWLEDGFRSYWISGE